jgi:hypothetical protein
VSIPTDAPEGSHDPFARAGLCAHCLHAQRIETSKESRFILCQYSKIDETFPKYPRLPMTSCSAYEEARP